MRTCLWVCILTGVLAPLLVVAPAFATEAISAGRLRCEYKVNPLGIDVLRPRLSWQIQAAGRGIVQSAYRIRAATTLDSLQAGRSPAAA